MIKKIKYIIVMLLMLLSLTSNVNAKEHVRLYLFWGDGCPHCAAEKEFLSTLEKKFINLEIIKYEVWLDEENNNLLKEISAKTNRTLKGVPVTIIGPTIINGFSDKTEQEIKRAISYYSKNKHQDIVLQIKNGTYQPTDEILDKKFQQSEQKLNQNTTTNIPIIGKINFNNYAIITAVPILGVLASISLLTIWLILTLTSYISLETNKKTKLHSLGLSFLTFGIASIISQKLQIEELNIVAKIIILLICVTLIILKMKKKHLPTIATISIALLFAMAIGMLTNPKYLNILNYLINVNATTLIINIAINIGYLFSYLVMYILLLLLFNIILEKIKIKYKEIVSFSMLVITMITIILI